MPSELGRGRSDQVGFDQGYWIDAEGARIAVLTCTLCGALVQNDPGTYRHKEWHEANSPGGTSETATE